MARPSDMFPKVLLINFEYLVASWSWFMKFLLKGVTQANMNDVSVTQVWNKNTYKSQIFLRTSTCLCENQSQLLLELLHTLKL